MTYATPVKQHPRTAEFDYLTLRHSQYGGVDVLGWGEYPDDSDVAEAFIEDAVANDDVVVPAMAAPL